MDDKKNVGGRDRLLRGVLAAVLAVVSLRRLRSGKRTSGLLAGIGALGIGATAATRYCGINDALGRDTTESADETTDETTDEAADAAGQRSRPTPSLTCAACGEPIRVGQSRGPNDADEIVHGTCA